MTLKICFFKSRLFCNQYKHQPYLFCFPEEMVHLWPTVFKYSDVLLIDFCLWQDGREHSCLSAELTLQKIYLKGLCAPRNWQSNTELWHSWGWKRPSGSNACSEQGSARLGCSGPHTVWFWFLQGWRLHNLLGNLFQCLTMFTVKKGVSLHVNGISCISVWAHFFLSCHWASLRSPFPLFLHPHVRYTHG